MQTQLELMSKKNKVAVPFYSPPSRLYGQTPAEIIKEARAAVMNPPATGIKPVFTSRPFTPKEKERTLFGNVKKRSGRPPSTFSLRNLQSQELGPRVKLPSIETVSKRKIYTTYHYSNNLSLDNLTEDYDAEALEEVGEIDEEKLPKWKKAHSCPKEGRMIKASSYNELSSRMFNEESIGWDEFRKVKKESDKLVKSDNGNGKAFQNENISTSSTMIGDGIKTQKSYPQPNIHRRLNMTRGGGDWESSDITQEPLVIQKINLAEGVNKNFKSDLKDNSHLKPCSEISLGNEEIKAEQISKIKAEKIDNKEKTPEISKKEQNKLNQYNEKTKEVSKREENLKTNENIKVNKKIISSKSENHFEKSIGTEPKSEYLLAMKKGYKNSDPEVSSNSIPIEILELYETARFYGVDVGGSEQNRTTSGPDIHRKKPGTKIEDYFGESPTDYLNQLKDNSNKINEKINNINEASEKVVEKAKQKTEAKKVENSSENVEFVMNNKKRYHVISDKRDIKEKAYKKWNNKQLINNSESKPRTPDDGWDLFWKNSYFRSKDEDEGTSLDRENSQKAADLECLKRLVNRLFELTKIGPENRDIYETTDQLYNLVKNCKMTLDSKIKTNVLKSLYLYADNENPQVLLSLARLLLHLKVESSLPVAFKMIFKVARFDTNDNLFLNEEDILELFLDGIGRSSPLDNAESCIYGYGALKFLTMNQNILSRILHMGALDLMTLHLKMINTAHMEKGSVEEQTQHALFQLTGALRHVAAGEGALPLFLTTNCVTIVCKTLQLFFKDDDIVTNISRTLSSLSPDESVTQVLMSIENILVILIELIERYKENDKILIRLSYCLGNIVEHSDLARVQLSRNDASLTILLNALNFYTDKDLEISMKEDGEQNSEGINSETIDDIIVKLIRIIANMSMNPIVGSKLSPTTNEKKSLQLSKLLSVLLMRKDPGVALLATLGCLNNISYYCNTHSVLIDITQGVERVLGLPSEDCQAEAARVLGNLTRHKEIRDLIYSTGGVNQLIKLLTSQDQEVVRCACGALVNMMLDPETRKDFIKDRGIDKLVNAFELFSGDWSLASLAARAIWNSCADDLSSAMLYNNMEHLQTILANSLEEDSWNDGDPAWEEFASIATDLLERINTYLEST